MFEKCPKYVGNNLDRWEMAQICSEMASLFDKRLKNLENYLEIFKWLRNLTNGLNMCGMTYVCGKSLKYLRNG